MSGLWRRAARPIRPLVLPERAFVIGVGGATLGGSGKTPLVMEIARRLSTAGVSSAVVATCYRTRVGTSRSVTPDDRPACVGDEAVMMRAALESFGVPVIVGPRRQPAVELAASLARCVIVDGLLQSRPARLGLSVLALDAVLPWGARQCPPAGDLRAGPDVLLEACDYVLLGQDETSTAVPEDLFAGRPALVWRRRLDRARPERGPCVGLSELAGRSVGLLTTVARPERLIRQLVHFGIWIVEHRRFGDHSRPSARPARLRPRDIDLWLTTAKCWPKVGPLFEGLPVWVLEERVAVPDALVGRIVDRARA
jgi:tetraacyldisaccharide 4'-kinase